MTPLRLLLRLLGTAVLLFAVALSASAQGRFVVKNFYLDERDLTASLHETEVIEPWNGKRCALIKIQTGLKGLTFDFGSTLGRPVKIDENARPGEVWVYAPPGAKRIFIYHADYEPLRDHRFGTMALEAGRTYVMELAMTGTVERVYREEVTSQYLVFSVTPASALLLVDEQPWQLDGEGSATRYLPFGEYAWRASAAGYHPDAGTVRVDDPKQKHVVEVRLRPAHGWVEVAGDGALAGASVYVDGALVGTAPVRSGRIASGEHSVRIVKAKYRPHEERVAVLDGETTALSPTLVADYATVTLECADAEAEIWVNDVRRGVGSWTGELAAGDYRFETKRAHHRPMAAVHHVDASPSAQRYELAAPTPIYGRLNVAATPLNAEILLDGRPVGQTPLMLPEVLEGEHTVTLHRAGYADMERRVTVTEGETATVDGAMDEDGESAYIRAYQSVSADGTETSFSSSKSGDKTVYTVNGVSFTMVIVEGGTFTMGATIEQKKPEKSEKPAHQVTLSTYAIGETEVTQALWQAVMGSNPSRFKGDDLPVVPVDWEDCQKFIEKLNALTGERFRLPTEAEWEYAARGGRHSKGYQYSGSNTLSDVAWYRDNADKMPHPVATKRANELGLYDMSGNVSEWCQDWFDPYYSRSEQTNPTGPASGYHAYRVQRGGCWRTIRNGCRVASRGLGEPSNEHFFLSGFRLAR